MPTFCCTTGRSSVRMVTSMPVRSVKALILSRMAKDGGVFSDMNTSLEPAYCFHLASSDEAACTGVRVIVEPRPSVMRAHAKGGGCTATEFEELAAADALVDSIFRNRKHARFLPY